VTPRLSTQVLASGSESSNGAWVEPGLPDHSELRPDLEIRGGKPRVSVVAPVHNEAPMLAEFVDEVAAAMHDDAFELVCVDDGSTDGSADLLVELAQSRPWMSVKLLATNFGQTAALAAGIDAAAGDIIVLTDSDGQNDPADIPALLTRLAVGADVVSGWRKDRKESLTRRILSGAANRVIATTSGVQLHDSGCSLKAYRRDVLVQLTLMRDDHRFLPALAGGLGARVAEVPVRDRERRYGKSHYGLSRIPRVAADLFGLWMLLRFRGRPLRAATWLGAALATMWIALAVILSATGSIRLGVLCVAVAITIGVVSVTLGAATEERRRSLNRPIYRLRADDAGIHQ
jgi:glycosyltransferase involved in cell wall biosynthesis